MPELLSRFKKRSYTKVDHTRSNNIWTSREEVLAYEKALHLETLLDEVIEGPKDKDKVPQTRNQSRPPAKEPITSAGGKHLQTPLKMPATISNLRTPISPAVKGEDDLDQKAFNPPEDDLHDADIDVKKEVQVKRHIDKWLYSMSKESVTRYTSLGRVIAPGLERFCDGTRTRLHQTIPRANGPPASLCALSYARQSSESAWFSEGVPAGIGDP